MSNTPIIIQKLELDYKQPIKSTEAFAKVIKELNKELKNIKDSARMSVSDIDKLVKSMKSVNKSIEIEINVNSKATNEAINKTAQNIINFGVANKKVFTDAEEDVRKYIQAVNDTPKNISVPNISPNIKESADNNTLAKIKDLLPNESAIDYMVSKFAPGWIKLIPWALDVVSVLGPYIYNMMKAGDVTAEFKERQKEITETSIKQKESIEKTKAEMLAQAEMAERLADKIDELSKKENLNFAEKAQMKSIVEQLNSIYPNISLIIDEQTGKLNGNTSAIRENIKAMKDQAIQQAYKAKTDQVAGDYVVQEILAGDLKLKIDEKKRELKELEKSTDQSESSEYENGTITGSTIRDNALTISNLKGDIEDLTRQWEKATDKLSEYDKELDKLNKREEYRTSNGFDDIPLYDVEKGEWIVGTPKKSKTATNNNDSNNDNDDDKNKNYKNEALANALKQLDYEKYVKLIDTEVELAKLIKFKKIYSMNADELLDIDKRIYSARENLKSETLKHSVDWINEKKSLDELSIEEEIAAWERVLLNQKDNIEAEKQANLNLHMLRKQLLEETSKKEEDIIRHLANISKLSTEEQIERYKELYSVQAKNYTEEHSRTENLFNLYKNLLSEQQNKIKEAYDDRIKQIDEEANKKKKAKQEEIKNLQEELKLLDRKDSERSYEHKTSDIQKDIDYWSIRTGEDARKKLIELQKQLEEEKYKHELEMQKQNINDKIDGLEGEVDEIERLANEEKDKYKIAYEKIAKAFDEHGAYIVAAAGTMAQNSYNAWKENYLDKILLDLKNGNLTDFQNTTDGLNNSLDDLKNKTPDYNGNINNFMIYSAANSILELKKRWHDGDISAAGEAKEFYDKLRGYGINGVKVAETLNAMDYEKAKNYIAGFPKYHTGGLAYSEGLAVLKKDELIFPPELSAGIRNLFPLLKSLGYSNNNSPNSYDNRKSVQIGTLLNIENNLMEDDIDGGILSRQLYREIKNLQA